MDKSWLTIEARHAVASHYRTTRNHSTEEGADKENRKTDGSGNPHNPLEQTTGAISTVRP
ncbi:hypothetical protein EMIT0324P_280004 [Pseudomonas chlororaphis]